MMAAESGQANVVELLLDTPSVAAHICAQDSKGANALMLAASGGHTEAVRVLLTTQSGRAQADRSTATG